MILSVYIMQMRFEMPLFVLPAAIRLKPAHIQKRLRQRPACPAVPAGMTRQDFDRHFDIQCQLAGSVRVLPSSCHAPALLSNIISINAYRPLLLRSTPELSRGFGTAVLAGLRTWLSAKGCVFGWYFRHYYNAARYGRHDCISDPAALTAGLSAVMICFYCCHDRASFNNFRLRQS